VRVRNQQQITSQERVWDMRKVEKASVCDSEDEDSETRSRYRADGPCFDWLTWVYGLRVESVRECKVM
jgi:hypothetical protein